MIIAVEQFTERLNAAIERERIFTRDAGHELRTPVAVFKGSLDLMEQNQRPTQARRCRRSHRMRKTVEDMEVLLETLLLLAREEELAAPAEPVLVNDVVSAQLDTHELPGRTRACNQTKLAEEAELQDSRAAQGAGDRPQQPDP